MGSKREGVRESNGQSKVYSQWGYFKKETLLNIDLRMNNKRQHCK
jgi:hypothetical protein